MGIVSGGAPGDFGDAIALGLDAFLTGETAEHVMADARENGVHFIAGGHYATERFGIRRLGELVAERFGVEHQFRGDPEPDLTACADALASDRATDTLRSTSLRSDEEE